MKNLYSNPSISAKAAKIFFIAFFTLIIFRISVTAQTYTTKANGAWSSASTWVGGVVPSATNVPASAVINIQHVIIYSGANIVNNGTININNSTGITPRLLLASGVNFTNNAGAKLYVTGGVLQQYRFVGGGQSGVNQTGNFSNSGLVQINSSYVEIAQGWTNQNAGIVVFKNSSLIIGQDYQTNNTSIDTLSYTSVSVGWQNGNGFTEGGASVYFQSLRVEVASNAGSFTISNNVVANGEIDFITLKNNFTGVYSNGKIVANPGVITTGVTLQAYCVSNSSNYQSNGKFLGTQTSNCSLNYFPATLFGSRTATLMNFSVDPVLIAGTDKQVGAQYKYESIVPGIDAIVKIDSLIGGATIAVVDDNSGSGFIEGFQPQIKSGSTVGASYAVFTFTYNITGTSTNSDVDTLNMTALDIDGSSSLKEFDQISLGTGATAAYVLSNPVISLTQVSTGTFKGINVDGVDKPGIDTSAKENMFTVKNINVSSFTIKLGMVTTQSQQTTRLYSIYMKSFVYPNISTLPVKMESFNATLNNNNQRVDLKWTTATEINVSHFVVERSLDGVNYKDAGLVFAVGNSTQKVNYSLSDNISSVQSPVIYYRLRSVDIDGKFEYSEVRIIRISKQVDNTITITAYPNPATNQVNVTIPNNWQNKKVVFEIFNANGQVSKRSENNSGSQTETISVGNLASGFYVVRVSCDGETAQQKIIKK